MDWRLIASIILILIAAVLYTTGFVLNWFKKYPHSYWYFFIGWLCFDVPGTTFMYLIAEKIKFNLHTIPGMIGFILMAIAAFLGLKQIRNFKDKLTIPFRYVEVPGYIIWMTCLVIGVLTKIQQ